jgi:hypothetical protein
MPKLTAQTEATDFLDTDIEYIVKDPAGSPLSRKVTSLTKQRYYPMPQNAITGLALSNNGTDANNDIDIAAGRIGASTGDYNLILTSARTKQLDATWAVGTNQGGLDTGAKANSTWYHVWLIARVDTHVVDVLFSTSATAPTMPTNYTKKRRIGAIKTNSSGNIISFIQYNDTFMWLSPAALDVDVTNQSTTRVDYTLASVPTGFNLEVMINVLVSGGASRQVYFSNTQLTDVSPSLTVTPLSQVDSIGTNTGTWSGRVITNTSGQISARSNGASTTLKIAVLGWIDPRGKW